MKNALKYTFLVLAVILIVGFLLPFLISAPHTELVAAGFLAIIFGIGYLTSKVKDKLNENQ